MNLTLQLILFLETNLPGMYIYNSKANPSNHNMNKTAFDLLSKFSLTKKKLCFQHKLYYSNIKITGI